jgi:hypothetical protein
MAEKKTPIRKSTKGVAKKKPSTATSKKPKVKKLRLNSTELRLLEFPPTEHTRRCQCGFIASKETKTCIVCGEKPEDLLWPIYLAACAKVGISPGEMWKIMDTGRGRYAASRKPKTPWKEIELPEGYSL